MQLRQAFVNGIKDLALEHDNAILVESDVQCGARDWFLNGKQNQYLETGIAEANAVGICAGMESEGYVPFWYTYGFLIGMVFNQIKQSVGRDNRNVKMFGYNCGVSTANKIGGSSHNCVDDIGLMRLIPNMAIVVPADNKQMYSAVKAAYDWDGAVYVRFGAGECVDVTDGKLTIGKASLMREGTKLTIVCNGVMVKTALDIADEFGGIDVLNMSTVKPLDMDALVKSAKKTGSVVVLEEHYLNCGMGESIARDIGMEVQVWCIGLEDVWTSSGKGCLREHYHLDAGCIRRFVELLVS